MISAESLAEPLHPTVQDALRNTPVAPLLGQPVEQILAGIGLPALPQLPALPPLPGLPALPPLDLAALAKPITDLFSGFGDGQLGASGAINPQTLLQNVVQSVETAMQFATQGIQLLQTMQSSGAQAATATAVGTHATSAAIATQAAQMHFTMGGAAGTVAVGYTQLAAVAARFALTTAALGPALVTPPGQAALLASAVEAGTEAVAITAQTKAQLAAHSAKMAKDGTKVQSRHAPNHKVAKPVAAQHTVGRSVAAPTPAKSPAATASTMSNQAELQQLLTQLQQVIRPLMSAAEQAGKGISATLAAPQAPVDAPLAPPISAPVLGAKTTAGPIGSGGGAATETAAAQLGRWQAANIIETVPGSIKTTVAPTGITTVSEEALPPVIPGGGALGAGRARGTGGGAGALVDARNGDELVGGAPDDTTAPVIGGSTPADPENPYHL
ncbi:hypothetical protein OHB26_21460 [Nocardia sp. NBC_01503]|uniref:hypothetical protein n=1 Tax=Nocardia sp. NBC_01503 TaxID=2975997 RepID=UPI002E7AFD5E|nr:hypothetical protein [Nocardia sp. NBC_01503]WTL29554.1 hypothetical protein OHB26_21460 [Nocardia sp. NBC_01503]